MNRKQHADEAGYIAERKNRFTGRKNVIYRAAEQGLDVGGMKYAIVCDAHGTIVGATNLPDARGFMKYPEFCEECMKIAKDIVEYIENETGRA